MVGINQLVRGCPFSTGGWSLRTIPMLKRTGLPGKHFLLHVVEICFSFFSLKPPHNKPFFKLVDYFTDHIMHFNDMNVRKKGRIKTELSSSLPFIRRNNL
jgi:hypothetical protein